MCKYYFRSRTTSKYVITLSSVYYPINNCACGLVSHDSHMTFGSSHTHQNIDHFDDIGPSVVMASPGMMQSGLSRQLFEAWCTDKRNGVVIAGYCVEGTLAKVRGERDSCVSGMFKRRGIFRTYLYRS